MVSPLMPNIFQFILVISSVLFIVSYYDDMVYADLILDDYNDGVYHVSVNNKIFDVFYEINHGYIDEISIDSHSISFQILESDNAVVYFYVPSAMLRTSESCSWGFSTLLDPMDGTPTDFRVEPTKNTRLSDSGYTDVVVYYNGDPAVIYLTFSTDIIFEGSKYHPHCQKPLQWAKQDAALWSNNVISDSHFGSMIQLMIEHGLVNVSAHTYGKDSSKTHMFADKITYIPSWLQNSAKWWNQESISNDEFLDNLEYLINNDIIKFQK